MVYDQIDGCNENGSNPLVRLEPERWAGVVEVLQNDLKDILRKENRFRLLPELPEASFDLLIGDLEVCIGENLSQLSLLYKREYQGVWWSLHIMRSFGIPRFVPIPLIIHDYAPITTFVSLFLFLWYNTPKSFEEIYWIRILVCIGFSIFVFMVLVSLANGRLVFCL